MNEKSRRIEVLKENLAKAPPRSASTIRTAENLQRMEQFKSKQLSLEPQRTELLRKFEPSYRLVPEVDEEIAHAKSSMEAAATTYCWLWTPDQRRTKTT